MMIISLYNLFIIIYFVFYSAADAHKAIADYCRISLLILVQKQNEDFTIRIISVYRSIINFISVLWVLNSVLKRYAFPSTFRGVEAWTLTVEML